MRQQTADLLQTSTEEEYFKIYQTTGIEIDDRRDFLQKGLQQYANEDFKRYAEFVKAVPGFRQLPIEDQTALFKGEESILLGLLSEFFTQLQLRLWY